MAAGRFGYTNDHFAAEWQVSKAQLSTTVACPPQGPAGGNRSKTGRLIPKAIEGAVFRAGIDAAVPDDGGGVEHRSAEAIKADHFSGGRDLVKVHAIVVTDDDFIADEEGG